MLGVEVEGLRKISVDGHALRWRLNIRDEVVVISAERSGPQLYVSWGWVDVHEPEGPGKDPQVVTPSFVAEAVQFALRQGWNPAVNGPSVRVQYAKDSFSVVHSNSGSIEPHSSDGRGQ